MYILPILSFAINYNIPKLFELRVESEHVVRNDNYGEEGAGAQEEEDILSDFISDIDNKTSVDIHEHNSSPTPDTIWVRITPIFVIIFPNCLRRLRR